MEEKLYEISQKLTLLEEQMDEAMVLLKKQESRAKWGMFWKFLIFFLIVVLPFYLSYKMLSGIDFSAMSQGLNSLQNLQDTSNSIDMSEVMKLLGK